MPHPKSMPDETTIDDTVDDTVDDAGPNNAEVEMAQIAWDGRTWEFPANDGDWDFEAIEALEAGRGIAFLRSVLGRKQMAKFALGGRRRARDADELMTAIMEHLGQAKQGE